jgi:hypothetical protein
MKISGIFPLDTEPGPNVEHQQMAEDYNNWWIATVAIAALVLAILALAGPCNGAPTIPGPSLGLYLM